jgi:RND family efflux transporter MFP subunit
MLAYRSIEIRSPVTGLLESVPHGRGQAVKKGAVVATLEATVEKSAVFTAQQKVAMAGALDSGKARVELLTRKFERRSELAADRALSLQDRDDADLERRLAQAELKQAQESHELATRELQQAQDQLNRRVIRSPIDGLVVDQYVQPGELVDPADNKRPILKLVQFDPLRVELMAPVAQFGKVKVGDTVTVMPEAPIGGRIQARVKLVDRMLDPSSGMFGVRLEVPNPQLLIPPGVACKVQW